MKQSSVTTNVFMVLGFVVLASVRCNAQGSIVPENTTVAIIPILNSSGEKNDGFRTKQTESGNTELIKEFKEHGFKLANQDDIKKAIAALKIDLTDEEQQKRDILYKIGKAVSADLIAFAVITDTAQQIHDGVLSRNLEGRAKVKLWLLNVKSETPIVSAVTKEGKSGGGAFPGFEKGSTRIIIAVANAVRDELAGFFKPYAPAKKEIE